MYPKKIQVSTQCQLEVLFSRISKTTILIQSKKLRNLYKLQGSLFQIQDEKRPQKSISEFFKF